MCWSLDFWMRSAIIAAELLALCHNRIQIVVNLWTYIIMCLSIISIIITLFLAFRDAGPFFFCCSLTLSLFLFLLFQFFVLPFSCSHSYFLFNSTRLIVSPLSVAFFQLNLILGTHKTALILILDAKFLLFVNSKRKKTVSFACAENIHQAHTRMTQYYC